MVFDCVVWCAKYLLCIFNFIFFVLGTIIFGVGLWLAVDKHSLIALLKLVESERIEQFTQTQVIEQLAYVLIVIGAVMFFMSFLGYLGAMRESRCLLSTGNRTIPEACCVLKDVAALVPRDEDCVTNPSDSNSFYKKGCYEVFTEWLIGQRELIIIVIGVGIVHLILIILAFSLCKAFAKYNDMRL
ncbi:GL15661 [Drosophila persimilis]|uniref:GL15661 n=1 Tax=Drosophila persimilis TaxID=7234 RepID=B4HD50_DROPE|nr:GL15661 [Drosophila persimilis]